MYHLKTLLMIWQCIQCTMKTLTQNNFCLYSEASDIATQSLACKDKQTR